MSQRIRYVQSYPEYLFKSVRNFVGVNGHTYTVTINTRTNKFEIYDNEGSCNAIEGEGTNLNNIKLKAKKALLSLGVEFEEETRTKPAISA
jgi:hypothetical protein